MNKTYSPVKKIIKVTKQSGIPLVGTIYFGIMDRNTSIIEVRPTTLCNINCTFCSVAAGPKSTYETNFVVEKSYLVEELKKLLDFKEEPMDIWINPQGDPTVYPELEQLIADIRKLKHVREIIIVTNGMLLTKEKIDAYKKAGLTQISLSIQAFSLENAKKLADLPGYNIEKIKDLCPYIAKNLRLVLTPVYLKNHNEEDIEQIVKFATEINAEVSIQNFQRNRRGRNPTSELSWKKFAAKLKEMEQKYSIDLLKTGKIKRTRILPKVAKKGQIITVNLVCDSKFKEEKIAVYQDKCIVVYGSKHFGMTKIKILKASNNLYYGKAI
ncbi:MAG: radical SAM protein [Candidatus Woesearchaeota archaeon]|nr:radical SAM protein [Candidatus Woesearchaeota archaeon]MDP7323480.1 radical SAM protein [Candidatus Woesearchaeota archaeon]MDP7457574.1 radical SAM protein [Candidatus Woesearchaeota archaeon]